MGFDDNDYSVCREVGMSDSAIYHCAGDSIVVTCLMALFGQMLDMSEQEVHKKINDYIETLKEK